MNPRRAFTFSRRKQRGSILVPAAMGLLIGAVLLGGIQVGYLIYAKRDMQKAADLAALTGAQVLNEGTPTECAQATLAASTAAQVNTASGFAASNMEVSCARWDPAKNAVANGYLAPTQPDERANAIKITMSRNLPSMVPFMDGVTLSVESVAARPGNPIAAFSVGTTLVKAQGQPGNLINLLAAAGVNLDGTALVGYDAGLANVKITTAGLLNALGIKFNSDTNVVDLNNLLASNSVALGDVIKAVILAGGQSEVLNADALVGALTANLKVSDLDVTLGSNTPGRSSSLFANITAGDGKSVLNANINALDLIATAVSVAANGHAVQMQTPVNIFGLVNVTTSASVIEPAQIAIGGVGTTAYSAQTRVFLQVTSANLTLLGLINFKLDLPIAIDVVAAEGTLTDLCDSQDPSGHDQATIRVDSSLMETCIGDLTAATAFSSSQPCSTGLQPKQLLTLKVGVDPGPYLDLGVKSMFKFNPLHDPAKDVTLYEQQQVSVPTTTLAVGDALANISAGLTNGLLGYSAQGSTAASASQAAGGASSLATKVWNDAQAQNSCKPDSSGQDGYNCRLQLWKSALNLGNTQSTTFGGYVSGLSNPPAGLTGLGSVISNVTNVVTSAVTNLTKVLSGVAGILLPTGNTCASWSLLGGYKGSAQGCINEIANTFSPVAPGSVPNAVPALLNDLKTQLLAPLNSLGTTLLGLIQNTLGLNINSTDVRLISLQCNGKGVQLVY